MKGEVAKYILRGCRESDDGLHVPETYLSPDGERLLCDLCGFPLDSSDEADLARELASERSRADRLEQDLEASAEALDHALRCDEMLCPSCVAAREFVDRLLASVEENRQ